MGWGTDPHEGFAEEQRNAGEWTDGLWRSEWGQRVAQRAACSCGWRGETIHPVPPSPGLDSPAWGAYETEMERVDELIYAEWSSEHYDPILGYDPTDLLILGRDAGGQRHFLAGRPIHAGTTLELLLPDGHWQRIRYEWSWQAQRPPTADMALGGPRAAEKLHDVPVVTFDLPPRAALRWPRP